MDRQRILLIFGAAFVSALLLSWFLYAKTTAPKTEKLVRVVAAVRDLPAGTRLKKGDLKMVSLAEKDLPGAAVNDEKLILERSLLYPVNRNEALTTTKLASLTGADGIPSTIAPGKRAVSVQITDATGVAGLLQPRAHVDVLFTRPGTMTEAVTTTILQDIVVLSVGRVTEAGGVVDTKLPRPQSQAVTLLVTPEEAGKLELARNQGKISLALRNPLDNSRMEEVVSVTGDALDPLIDSRRLKSARARAGLRGTLRDDKAWAELTGGDPDGEEAAKKKAPPKPRHVVDVYRGDKHVQEIFHQ